MKKELFEQLKQRVIDAGYGDEIVWQEKLYPVFDADQFYREYVWVVLSSGMKNQIARLIESRIYDAWNSGRSTSSAFGHKGKVKAIDYVSDNRHWIFSEYLESTGKVEYLATLPWIGDITKWHLAKNLGLDTAKPDRHLERISAGYKTTPFELCQRLATETGYRVSTVDLIIWRAANLGFV